jgi:hypothetical protein
MRRSPTLAIDRAINDDRLIAVDLTPGNRRIDANGNLHIEVNNIAKANVCPYYGREIPGWSLLGLDANKLYRLYRDPEELAKSAEHWNNIQVTFDHPAEAARTLRIPKTSIIGSTGTDASFQPPFVRNSIVVWDSAAVDMINAKKRYQLSPAYQFTAVMTPGVVDGIAFDGKMTDIKPNHVALVERGRQGAEVAVGDKRPELPIMLKSRRALMLHGALSAHIAPLLAADKTVDLAPTLETITAADYEKPETFAAKVLAVTDGALAEDSDLTAEEISEVITAVAGITIAEDDAIPEVVANPNPKPRAKPAAQPQPTGITQAAMDAAIAEATAKAANDAIARMQAVREAEIAVEPFIGKLATAQDSAAAVYKLALDHLKVDYSGVPEEAYRALLLALPKPQVEVTRTSPAPRVGMDEAARKRVSEMFPDAKPLIRS